MKGKYYLLIVITTAMINQTFGALLVTDPSCRVDTYASYSHANLGCPWGMTFDSTGNLYVNHENGGYIYRIDINKNDTRFVTGLNTPEKIVWGGGTSYGDNLYVTEVNGDKVKKITPQGAKSFFCQPNRKVLGIGIDRVGHYGGYMYTGTSINDHIDKVTSAGDVQKFSDFPYGISGNVQDIDFDPGSDFGGLMYAATYSSSNRAWSGVFSLDSSGNPQRFAPDIINGGGLEFDTYGLFENVLFIRGMQDEDTFWTVYQADSSGQVTKFAYSSWHILSMTFGSDGALYVSEYESSENKVIISRIIPEPATLALLALGAAGLSRRRKTGR